MILVAHFGHKKEGMNMNTKAKILMPYLSFCLMTLAVTLMLNCGKDKNENPPAPQFTVIGISGNVVNMDGTWTAPCFYSAQDQEDSLDTVTFSGRSFTYISTSWSASVTSNCTQTALPDVVINVTGSATTGATGTAIWMDGNTPAPAPAGIPVNAKATAAAIAYSSAVATLQSDEYVTIANTNSVCGGGWVKNVAKNVLNCTDIIDVTSFQDYWVVDDSASPLKYYSNYDDIAWHVDIKSIMTK